MNNQTINLRRRVSLLVVSCAVTLIVAGACKTPGRISGQIPGFHGDNVSLGGATPSEPELGGAPLGSDGGAGGASPLPPEDDVCSGFVCGQNQACVAEGDFALCKCLSGYGGPSCEDINECEVPGICGEGGTCENYLGTYSCSCESGLTSGASGCQDIDECDEGTDACDAHAECTNAEGTHLCTCEPGRFGDGTFCKLTDHCAEAPCGEGTCRNTPTGIACECPLGTAGPTCEGACSLHEAISFASDILEAAIRKTTGIVGDITPSALAPFTSLSVAPPDINLGTEDEIDSLDGLECWPTLETLDLRGHRTTDLSAIASLGSLRTLNLECTRAEDLTPLANLSQLRELDISKGGLCSNTSRMTNASLDFATELTNLRTLAAESYGYLNDIDALSKLARLENLFLRGNEISSIEALRSLSQLRKLSLAQNPLESLEPLSGLPHLVSLDLSFCDLTDILPLNSLSHLEEFNIRYNSVENLAPISGMSALKFAYFNQNEVIGLDPLAQLENLVIVDLEGNQVQNLAPLSENLFFSGGQLVVSDNSLECDEVADQLATLRGHGVSVRSDCE